MVDIRNESGLSSDRRWCRLKSEHAIQSEIMLALSKHGCIVARTNVGTVRTVDGRIFNAGPPPGWCDLTGLVKSTGQIVLIEVKNEHGQLRKDQKRFGEFIRTNAPNAIYGVCRSAQDAIDLINRGIQHDKNRIEEAHKCT